jgi:hypothetical protein
VCSAPRPHLLDTDPSRGIDCSGEVDVINGTMIEMDGGMLPGVLYEPGLAPIREMLEAAGERTYREGADDPGEKTLIRGAEGALRNRKPPLMGIRWTGDSGVRGWAPAARHPIDCIELHRSAQVYR